MERMLAVVFDNEVRAREGSRALEEMGEFGRGTIGVHSVRVVTKDSAGRAKVVHTYDVAPEGTMGGTALGSLIGMLGGPLGLAVGAVSGFVVGATADFARTRIDEDFVSHVAAALVAGKAALVAEIYEESTEPVDGRMKALGGVVHRRDLSDAADDAFQHEAGMASTRFNKGAKQ